MDACPGRGRSRTIAFALVALPLALPGVAPGQQPGALESQLTALLRAHTEAVAAKIGTRVDYTGLAGDPAWPRLIETLAAIDPEKLATRDERLAFWINAYNVLAIDLILQHRPVESIRDIGWLLRPVWGRDAGRIGGQSYSLDEIEHGILRPMGEPRIHGAIVCAAISCPNLRREAYTTERLDAQLDDNMRAWLARPEKGMRLDRVEGVLWLSPIFEWFGEDFDTRGGVLEVVTDYAPRSDRDWLRAHPEAVDIQYFDYDWKLNGR